MKRIINLLCRIEMKVERIKSVLSSEGWQYTVNPEKREVTIIKDGERKTFSSWAKVYEVIKKNRFLLYI